MTMTKTKKVRIYKTRQAQLKRAGYKYIDVARSLSQARAMLAGGYGKNTFVLIRKNTRKEDSFPYGIWTKDVRL